MHYGCEQPVCAVCWLPDYLNKWPGAAQHSNWPTRGANRVGRGSGPRGLGVPQVEKALALFVRIGGTLKLLVARVGVFA